MNCCYRGLLFSIAGNMACQSNDSLIDCDPNVRGIDAWLVFELIDNILPKPQVTHGQLLLLGLDIGTFREKTFDADQIQSVIID
jgi:hypothetical protein